LHPKKVDVKLRAYKVWLSPSQTAVMFNSNKYLNDKNKKGLPISSTYPSRLQSQCFEARTLHGNLYVDPFAVRPAG
jgi:hypothetical protein